ncbi:MAG: 50S ribosomal protein L15 [Isosphaeraceae bacterium]|jgi:large subunit ribosomal protein L15|nr:MAG: 50S ribosomal protein L15 [Isosphaeraceae bacterium]
MQLHDVHQGIHRHKARKRVGRGRSSGHGKTATKGHKGHSSRQGFKQSPLMEGGQMPIIRRVPKRGFNNGAFRRDYATLNVGVLEASFEAGATVDEAALRGLGLIKGRHDDGLKILGDGQLTKPLTVRAVKFSEQAAEKIRAAGGTVELVPPPRPQPQPIDSTHRPRAKPRAARRRAARTPQS